MYDPLSASSFDIPVKQATSPPATPSKSRISSRPPPYRPQQAQQQQSIQRSLSRQLGGPSNGVGNTRADGTAPGYTTAYRSQSPLAPRPPLPGQIQRPVSPIHWESSGNAVASGSGSGSNQPTPTSASSATTSALAAPFSPDTPNAWASSPPSSQTQQQPKPQPPPVFIPQYQPSYMGMGLGSPVAPVPVPSPTKYRAQLPGSPSSTTFPKITSPGVARSPIAERNERPVLSSNPSSSHTPAQPRAPPYIRIRVHGIDRAKKELGIKLDCTTNIPTYHRQQSAIFSRTYAEFTSLHAALSANHPETILPALPLPQTSATSEEEEDRFLKGIFQRFIDRITRDRALILDDELRGFVESDFGYTPLTRAKKLKSSSGFLSRSSSRPILVDENGEPDFLASSKVHSAALESSLIESCKILEKNLKFSSACSVSYQELGATWASFSTTESYGPLANGMKGVAEMMNSIAALEVGQGNATALILGDALAYSAVEAKSAKDALLQRQYNLDELHSSIKTSINKRRAIEKLRSSGSIKPEKVNEALDELDEAIKSEQNLNNRVDAISTNLRPSLQTHLKTMDEDMFSTLLHHGKTMLAYENRKLGIFEGLQERLGKISDKGNAQEGSIIYHQSPGVQAQAAMQPVAASGPLTSSSMSAASSQNGDAPAASVTAPSAAASIASTQDPMSSSASQIITPGAGVRAPQPSMTNSRFLQTQAQVQAQMQAAKEAEERLRQQKVQQQQQLRGMSGSGSVQSGVGGQPGSSQGQSQQQPLANPSVANSQINPQAAPPVLQSSQQRAVQSSTSSPLAAGQNNTSQSMFLPSSTAPVPAPASQGPPVRSPPISPARPGQQTHQSRMVSSSSIATIDPLSGLSGPTFTSSSSAQTTQRMGNGGLPSHLSGQSQGQGQANMSQSAFLPGRNANPSSNTSGYKPPPPTNAAEERKRMDARKAASMLAGAF